MNRRALLKTIGGSAVFGLAGCLTRRDDSGTEQPNNTTQSPEDTGDNDTTGTDSGSPGPRLTNSSFEVISTECGTEKAESSAAFESNSVRVSGTINGSNTCYTAKLERVTCEEKTLTVSVQSYERETDDLCSMCVTDIEYEASFEFENGLPQRTVVVHNGSEVLNEPRE